MSSRLPLCKAYEPPNLRHTIGNKANIINILRYLKEYRKQKTPEKHGIIIVGPGGCGKTTISRLLAIQRGYMPMIKDAAMIRKKEDFFRIRQLYITDMRNIFARNSTTFNAASSALRTCRLEAESGVGKAIIIDALDAVTKGDTGLLKCIIEMMKKNPPPPHTILIVNTTAEHYNAIKSLSRYLDCFYLQSPKPSDLKKLVDTISKGEGFTIPESVQEEIILKSERNLNKFYNLLEMWKAGNSLHVQDRNTASSEAPPKNDNQLVFFQQNTSLSVSNNGFPDIMRILLNESRGKTDTDVYNLVESEGNNVTYAIHHLYPRIMKISRKNYVDTLEAISDQLSLWDTTFASVNDMYYTGAINDGDEEMDPHGYTYIAGGVIPVRILSGKVNMLQPKMLKGYTKILGIKASRDGLRRTVRGIRNISKQLMTRSNYEIEIICNNIYDCLAEGNPERLDNLLVAHGMTVNDIDTIAKFKYIGCPNPLLKAWKGKIKKESKKYCEQNKPPVRGLKFKDEHTKDPNRQVIRFFPAVNGGATEQPKRK